MNNIIEKYSKLKQEIKSLKDRDDLLREECFFLQESLYGREAEREVIAEKLKIIEKEIKPLAKEVEKLKPIEGQVTITDQVVKYEEDKVLWC